MRTLHIVSVIAAAMLTACALGSTTPGQNGRADFAYEDVKCLFDCAVGGRAVASGARVGISARVHQGVAPIASVRSTDEVVAMFALGKTSSEVLMTAGSPGTAALVLVDARGEEIDRARVTVERTTELVINETWKPAAGPMVLAGTSDSLGALTRSENGLTVGNGAVKFTLEGPLEPGGEAQLYDGVSFKAAAPGVGAIHADCDDVHVAVPVVVIDAGAVMAVELSPAKVSFQRDRSAQVGASVKAIEGQLVYGAGCTWSSAPAGLTFATGGGGRLDGGPRRTYTISGKVPGSYTATCVAPGGVSATVDVTIN
jgi:hypothetical protein